MKICFVSTQPSSPWGGAEILWSQAAGRALERRHGVLTVTVDWNPRPEPIAKLAVAGATTLTYKRPGPASLGRRVVEGIGRRIFAHAAFPWSRVWRRAATWGPDLICISEGTAYEAARRPALVRFLQKSGLPYCIICQHCHESIAIREEEAIEKVIPFYRAARWLAFVANRNWIKTERELGTPLRNGILVKNPVNLTSSERVPWPTAGPFRFACVARLDHMFKGQDLLLEALAAKSWSARNWRLRFYGAGPSRPYLERLSTMYGVRGRIEFAGHVADVRGIWADNHLLVLPSRSEGTPLSLVEAMLCGRPSVVTDVGGNAEWVTEPATGFVAEAASTRSFAAALERAWAAREQWAALGERAHEAASQMVDPDPGGTLVDLLEQSRDVRPPRGVCGKSQPLT